MISIVLDHENFHLALCPSLQSIGTWIEFVCYYKNCVWKLHKFQLCWIGSQWPSGLLYPSPLYIHSIKFWEFDIETPTKILIYLLKKIIAMYRGTTCISQVSCKCVIILS